MQSKRASGFTAGLVMVVIGLILFGDKLDLAETWSMRRLWPLILVAVAVGNLFIRENRGFGVWLLFVGSLLLLQTHRIVLLRDSWPLFIVAFGLALLVGAWSQPAAKREG